MIAVAISYRRSFLTLEPISLPPSCERCKQTNDDKTREAMGCQGDSAQLPITIPCQDCGVEKCSTCGGSGWEEIKRCPMAGMDPQVVEFMQLHGQWPVLPFSGGIYDQPAAYVAAMRLLDYGSGLIQNQIDRDQEREMRSSHGGARSSS